MFILCFIKLLIDLIYFINILSHSAYREQALSNANTIVPLREALSYLSMAINFYLLNLKLLQIIIIFSKELIQFQTKVQQFFNIFQFILPFLNSQPAILHFINFVILSLVRYANTPIIFYVLFSLFFIILLCSPTVYYLIITEFLVIVTQKQYDQVFIYWLASQLTDFFLNQEIKGLVQPTILREELFFNQLIQKLFFVYFPSYLNHYYCFLFWKYQTPIFWKQAFQKPCRNYYILIKLVFWITVHRFWISSCSLIHCCYWMLIVFDFYFKGCYRSID